MKKIAKKISIISVILFAVCLSPLFNIETAGAAEEYAAKPDSYYDFVCDFTDVTAVNRYFHAYYLANALGSAKSEEVTTDASSADAHWLVQGGVLKRINDVGVDENGAFETNKISVLSFVKEAYLNFELSLDLRRGQTGNLWPVVGIRQVEEGRYYLDDGAGVFVQSGGQITLWGGQQVSGPHVFGDAKESGYKSGGGEWYNIQIKLVGNKLSVSINNGPYSDIQMFDYYETGYVSLFAVNNEAEFRNFRIKMLAEPEKESVPEFLPVAEADTPDALSNLAGEEKDAAELFEREGKVNPDAVYTEEITREITVTAEGCKGFVGRQNIFAAAIIFLAALPIRYRKKIQ